jgi:nucleotide-binding universal stress UspA family protein
MIILKNILIPTDFGLAAEAALRYGRSLADRFGADLHVLHVIETVFLQATFTDPLTMEATARRQLGDLAMAGDRLRFRTHTIVKKFDSPPDAIVRYATSNAIDLIVMGTHGRNGAAHILMGSVAERVVRTAPCPVLVVRHPEREFITDTGVPASVPA